ncbi:hypothetical protein GIB67_005607 [Kingdonia uniflora]|uniref:Coatomer subunit delta n=1 Tax=Kingdonia uniflora TaxID=39325 RepID=A0A7J7NHK9_9MAGN|nr:hypothetical protein GIB67_005607 [Kingdonia uniflora]
MVVLAASLITKSGKVLVSRQFVDDMSRIRVEGLLAAFPKLVGIGKQHTYVETESVRYVYQPIQLMYLLLVTNKQSNILQDLETLRLLSKLVPEYAPLDEEGISKSAFEMIFAFDEVISLGHKEIVSELQVKQYCKMESHEEKLHKLVMQSKINDTKDLMKLKASEIDKSKIDRNKRGYTSMPSMGSGRIENNFNDIPNVSGIRMINDGESILKSKGGPSVSAPPKGQGMQLGKTKRANQFLESLKAESEVIVEDVQPSAIQSRQVTSPPTDPITLTVEEKFNVTLRRDGGLSNFDVQGSLLLQILNQEDGLIQVQIATGENPAILFKMHPNINKELYYSENILGLKDPSRPFPTSSMGDAAGVVLLRWRMQSMEESNVPLTINCWPSVSGSDSYVSIEYEASPMFDLRNVIISVPLPTLREAPNVRQIDGEWRYVAKSSTLEWSILLIDNSNRSGSIEFVVPAADSSSFFPISVGFTAADTFSDLKVLNILPLKGGPSPRFSQRTQLITENYQVV